MIWALYSILAALTWAIVNIFDKFILTRWVKEPLVMTANVAITSLVISLAVFAINGFKTISTTDILFSLTAGVLYILGNFTYMVAVEKEEISKVIPLVYMDPLFTTVLAFLFLNEVLNPIKYFGVFILINGAMLISTDKFRFKTNKATFYAILTALIFSVGSIMMKTPLNHSDYWTVFAYTRLGVFFRDDYFIADWIQDVL